MTSPAVEDERAAGRDAYGRHAWREAYDHLHAANADGALEPPDLERLAESAWWTGRLQECLAAYERAYTGYVAAGDRSRAAFVAWVLAGEYVHKLQPSVAVGWFSRAERLLDGEPESRSHGFLELGRLAAARNRGDLPAAQEHARRAYDIGRRFDDRDLETLALHQQGCLKIDEGQVDEGLALLDEATVAAVAGEVQPRATAAVYCGTIQACRDLADYRRAGDWTEAARRWCERQAITGFPGVCRIHRAEVMRLRGAWREAEAEARRACEELREFALDTAAEGFYEIGEIRLRAGDLAGAAQAFAQADELGREPLPGLALLRLSEGRIDAAVSALRPALSEDAWDRLGRAKLLPAWVEVAIAAGDLEAAHAAAAEMESIAAAYGTPALRALGLSARGAAALASGDNAAAVGALRGAARLWRELDAPYEGARARLLLGRAFRVQGEEDAALRELQAARATFDRLGAQPDVLAAAALLGDEAGASAASPGGDGRATRSFVFTDIVGSTSLAEALGDDAWRDLLRWHDETLRRLVAVHGGEEVAHTGDGLFVSFADAGSALDCAVAIQRALAEHRRSHGFAPPVRIGVHRADALRRGLDYGGVGVHAAARIAALAGGGEILASADALVGAGERHATGKSREVDLRGISAPVTVTTVAWR